MTAPMRARAVMFDHACCASPAGWAAPRGCRARPRPRWRRRGSRAAPRPAGPVAVLEQDAGDRHWGQRCANGSSPSVNRHRGPQVKRSRTDWCGASSIAPVKRVPQQRCGARGLGRCLRVAASACVTRARRRGPRTTPAWWPGAPSPSAPRASPPGGPAAARRADSRPAAQPPRRRRRPAGSPSHLAGARRRRYGCTTALVTALGGEQQRGLGGGRPAALRQPGLRSCRASRDAVPVRGNQALNASPRPSRPPGVRRCDHASPAASQPGGHCRVASVPSVGVPDPPGRW